MLEYNRYQILNLNFINELDTVTLDSKFKYISDFIFRQVQGKSVFLFEMKPTKTSILYDIDPESEYHTINSRKVIYTKNLNLSKKVISMIVEDESFYLGTSFDYYRELSQEVRYLLFRTCGKIY